MIPVGNRGGVRMPTLQWMNSFFVLRKISISYAYLIIVICLLPYLCPNKQLLAMM